nr:glycosyltransferase family 25 protein [Aquabacterium sp.]
VLYIAQRTASWDEVAQLTAQLRAAHAAGQTAEANESPRTHLNWCGDEAANMAVLQVWSRQLRGKATPPAAPLVAPLAGRRLRVGYLSSDFRDHPTSRLILGVLRHHDHSQLELHLYCSGWDDGSVLRKAVVACADQVHNVAKLSDSDAAALIRSHGIDVLVELNGPTRAHRLGILAQRPAPVQIGYLGWPGSYGGGLADYIVADEVVAPAEAGPLYPEQLIRLHKTYQANDHAREQPGERPTRQQCGLPAHGGPVLGVFNAINKIDSTVWLAWLQVLRAVPDAVLWLLDPGTAARQNIAAFTRAQGVDPRRVLVAPRLPQAAHLARMGWCDLMLDPWPYGGHTSTTDALLAGVPVLALAGTNFASRVSGGLLAAAGLGKFVQPDVDSYVRMAIHLLRTPATLQRAKAFIAERLMTSDLVDAQRRTRQLESAYQRAAARAAAGQPPVQLPAPGRAALVDEVVPLVVPVIAPVVASLVAAAGPPAATATASSQPAAATVHPVAVRYINLDSCTERRAGMQAHLAALDLPWPMERFAALRGDGLPARITQGELGCLRSHQAVLEAMPTDAHTLVLEDDVRLPATVASHVQSLLRQGADAYDLLFIAAGVMYTDVHAVLALLQRQRALRAGGDQQLCLLPADKWYVHGAYAYLVHPRAAPRLAQALRAAQATGYTEPVDVVYRRLIRNGAVSAAMVFPFLAELQMHYPSTLNERPGQAGSDRFCAIANLFALESDTNALLRWVHEKSAQDGFDAQAYVAGQLIQQKLMQR